MGMGIGGWLRWERRAGVDGLPALENNKGGGDGGKRLVAASVGRGRRAKVGGGHGV